MLDFILDISNMIIRLVEWLNHKTMSVQSITSSQSFQNSSGLGSEKGLTPGQNGSEREKETE